MRDTDTKFLSEAMRNAAKKWKMSAENDSYQRNDIKNTNLNANVQSFNEKVMIF